MKKALALILSLALAVSALTACGGGASSSAAGSTSGSAPASAAPSGEKTVVTVWHMYAEDEEVTKPISVCCSGPRITTPPTPITSKSLCPAPKRRTSS